MQHENNVSQMTFYLSLIWAAEWENMLSVVDYVLRKSWNVFILDWILSDFMQCFNVVLHSEAWHMAFCQKFSMLWGCAFLIVKCTSTCVIVTLKLSVEVRRDTVLVPKFDIHL